MRELSTMSPSDGLFLARRSCSEGGELMRFLLLSVAFARGVGEVRVTGEGFVVGTDILARALALASPGLVSFVGDKGSTGCTALALVISGEGIGAVLALGFTLAGNKETTAAAVRSILDGMDGTALS